MGVIKNVISNLKESMQLYHVQVVRKFPLHLKQ